MAKELEVGIEGLGICGGCSTVVSMESFPAEAMNARWICNTPDCGQELDGPAFGYEQLPDGKWKKTRWVGPEGLWAKQMPTEDFKVGHFFVDTSRRHSRL